jgi:hypothetical protein
VRPRLLLGLALALALAACGQVERRAPEAEGQEGRSNRSQSLAEFLACARQWTLDYEPAEAPADLAREAHAVVTGTMVAVKRETTSVLEVKVDRVVAGDDGVVTDGSIYVELPYFDHASCSGPTPSASGVFFLDELGNGTTAPFFQGFLLEDASGKLISVWEPFRLMPRAWHGLDSIDEVLAEIG